MKKIFLGCLCSLQSVMLFSQSKKIEFVLELPTQKVSGSLYNKIEFLDGRVDTSYLGDLFTGFWGNEKSKIVASIPLNIQFSNWLKASVNGSSGEGELLINLRKLYFSQTVDSKDDRGFLTVRADIFKKINDSSYFKLNSIDTILTLKTVFKSVSSQILAKGSHIISSFITKNLLKSVSDSIQYVLSDIANLDKFEKQHSSLYSNIKVDGIYYNYESFKNQNPDSPIFIDTLDKNHVIIKGKNKKGKFEKINRENIYGFTSKGKLFVSCADAFHELKKAGTDFYFDYKGFMYFNCPRKNDPINFTSFRSNYNSGIYALNKFGAIPTKFDDEKTYTMKLDHLTGEFIMVLEIDNSK